jgi:hypothetical protein
VGAVNVPVNDVGVTFENVNPLGWAVGSTASVT